MNPDSIDSPAQGGKSRAVAVDPSPAGIQACCGFPHMTRRALLLLVLAAAALQSTNFANASTDGARPGFVGAVQTALPAVVNISARRIVETWTSPFANEPFWRFFRQHGQMRQRVENSLGSGVIASADGYVVTNHHVVSGALEILVELSDRRELAAEVVLADRRFDLAVLKLKGASGLSTLEMRDSDTLQIGEIVLAVGNPFGIGQTVSSGIVSGFFASKGYFVQTDAPIYSGNSGGALVDADGRLVGINTLLQIDEGGMRGIGFAIPSNLVEVFVDQARSGSTQFRTPWAGIDAVGVDRSLARDLGMERPTGVVVRGMHRLSPLGAAGLRAGDIVIAADEHEIHTPAELRYRMAVGRPGHAMRLSAIRNGRNREIDASLELAPENPPRETVTVEGRNVFRGMRVSNINPAVIVEYDLPLDALGVLLVEVPSALARIGLRRGDILLNINGKRVRTPGDVLAMARQRIRSWEIEVRRQDWRQVFRFRT